MKTRILKILFIANSLLFTGSLLAQAPANYYNGVEGKNKATLKTALYQIIKDPSVTSYKGLWEAFERTDKRPDNGKVWDMYSTKTDGTASYYFTFGQNQCGQYSAEGNCYNREHSFPKSWFNDASPMYSDLFHLYPTDGYVNNRRGNFPFGEVGTYSYISSNGSKVGTNTTPGYTGTVFEPIDEFKGDFARTYFYMATCYENRIGSWNCDMLAKNSYPAYKTWAIDLLLKWSREDPVSEKEINRNNAVYGEQGNRNPFIDFPGIEEYIWGNKMEQAFDPNNIGGTDPAVNISANSVSFAVTNLNVTSQKTINVKAQNLDSDLSVSISGDNVFSVNTSTITKTEAEQTNGYNLTINYTPTAYGSNSATITINGGGLTSSSTIQVNGIASEQAITSNNLLTNPSFELWTGSVADGWDFYSGSSTAVKYLKETTTVNHESSSLKIDNPSSGATSNASQLYKDNFTTGDTYEFSFDYFVVSGDNSDVRMWSTWKSYSGTDYIDIVHDYDIIKIGATVNTEYLPSNTGIWSTYSGETTVPANAAAFDFRLRTYKGSVVIFDNTVFKQKILNSINPDNIDDNIKIYPTNGYINVDITDSDIKYIEVYDTLGKQVARQLATDGYNKIPSQPNQFLIVKVGNKISKILTK